MGQGERNRKEESRRSRQTSHATGVVVFSMRMVVVVFSSRAGLIFSSVPVAFLPVVLFRQYEATRK